MITISNFSYAGTQKYVSHAVIISSTNELKTPCGMDVRELLDRVGQEWEVRETNEPHSVGCVKCLRLLTKRAPDSLEAGENPATWVIDPNNITPPAISG